MESKTTSERQSSGPESNDWSEKELRAAVDAYQEMLKLQEKKQPFSKSDINARLRSGPLSRRSKSAIEYRMQNISSIFNSRGEPWVQGYPPAANIGSKVKQKIEDYLASKANNKYSRRRSEHLLDSISKDHINQAVELYKSGYKHGFKDSTKFDLIIEGNRYPPKAIIGLAAVPLYGEPFGPNDFTGGSDSKCFRILTSNGFIIAPKEDCFKPTADAQELEKRALEALTAPFIPEPPGQEKPEQVTRQSSVYKRDPLVVAFTLKRAGGLCECCKRPAPFTDKNGNPFLEVHHIVPLSDGGEDKTNNTVAICPNCHRECHHGENAESIKNELKMVIAPTAKTAAIH